MKIGVVRERAPNERRVALVPEALSKLAGSGAEILVERGAGEAAAIPDSAYVEADARIVAAGELYSEADVIVRVSRPDAEEAALLRKGLSLIHI